MADFPTLYAHSPYTSGLVLTPVVGELEDTMAHDPTIRSQSDGGYVTSRARFTRISRRWVVNYAGVTQAHMNSIKAFEDARVGGSEAFTWTNPEDSTSYNMRFLGLVSYTPWGHTNFKRWAVRFILEQL